MRIDFLCETPDVSMIAALRIRNVSAHFLQLRASLGFKVASFMPIGSNQFSYRKGLVTVALSGGNEFDLNEPMLKVQCFGDCIGLEPKSENYNPGSCSRSEASARLDNIAWDSRCVRSGAFAM